jgi:methyl-accepting chemotaxis protein
MNVLTKWTVTRRLGLAFGALGLVVVLMGALTWWQQRQAQEYMRQLVERDLDRVLQVEQWAAYADATTLRIMAINKSSDAAIAMLFGAEIEPRVKEIQARQARIQAWATSAEEQAWFGEFAKRQPPILAAINEMSEARMQVNPVQAAAIFDSRFLPAVKAYGDELTRFKSLQRRRLADGVSALQARSQAQWRLGMTVVAVLLLLAGGFVLAVARHIRRSLDDAMALAGRVAEGDLSEGVDRAGRADEFGVLTSTLSDMRRALHRVVKQVREGATQIAEASSQIAHGNQDLSNRTERQAGHLQQTAAAMEELAATVRQTADNAQQANTLAGQASAVAQQGGEAVGRVVQTMAGITDASRRIEEIIGVIDGISFQTNILALNAAVEAARAGEQGRGFAVVAGEVRQLAQRSANAAREIKVLIADSADKVRAGSAQVESAGQTIEDLVRSVAQVTTLIGEISSAAAEQNAGISNMSAAVSELDQGTQQNAALVEQAAAAASSLHEQTRALTGAVQTFRLAAQP